MKKFKSREVRNAIIPVYRPTNTKLHIVKDKKIAQPLVSFGDYASHATLTVRYGKLFSKARKMHLGIGFINNRKKQRFFKNFSRRIKKSL